MTSDKLIRPTRNQRYTIEAQTLYPVNRVPQAVSCCTVDSGNTVSRRIQDWRFAVVGDQSQKHPARVDSLPGHVRICLSRIAPLTAAR